MIAATVQRERARSAQAASLSPTKIRGCHPAPLATQVSATKAPRSREFVRPSGLKPESLPSLGASSVQLSYGRTNLIPRTSGSFNGHKPPMTVIGGALWDLN